MTEEEGRKQQEKEVIEQLRLHAHIAKGHPVRFKLIRHKSVPGMNETGFVAEGVMFSSGKCVLLWRIGRNVMEVYDNLDDLKAVHCYKDTGSLEWID